MTPLFYTTVWLESALPASWVIVIYNVTRDAERKGKKKKEKQTSWYTSMKKQHCIFKSYIVAF